MAKVILVCGKICSGKSYYAEKIKEKYNAVILSPDEATYDLSVEVVDFQNEDKIFKDVDISIEFEDDGYKDYKEFKNNISGYIETLKSVVKNKGHILESLYTYAKEIYIKWEIKPDISSISDEYVESKTQIISMILYNTSAIITADLIDEDEENEDLLGGHQFELFFEDGQKFNWQLVG